MYESDAIIQKLFDAPTKWVGLYIAAASAVCSLAMAADVFHGLRSKKFWFPRKYFALNATFLTLLAVAMKPTMDLSDQLYKDAGSLTKVTSLLFMCTTMVSFMSSLGSMTDQAILTNSVAIGILTLTIVGNMWIQIALLHGQHGVLTHSNIMLDSTVFLFVLLVTLISSATAAPNIKRSLEAKYQEMHKVALREDDEIRKRSGIFGIVNQREDMKKYWVMAETSSPQFVMARLVVSSASSAICLLATFPLEVPYYRFFNWTPLRGFGASFINTESAYKWSTRWILAVQSIGIIIGIVAPTLRWLVNVRDKCSTMSYRNMREEFKIESYWIQILVDWRDNSLALQIRHDKCKKCFHDAKWLILNACIGVQILVVLLSKILVVLVVLLMTPFIACFALIRRLKNRMVQCSSEVVNSDNTTRVELSDNVELNLSRYVLLLDGEPELPKATLTQIGQRADKAIQTGKKQQPKNLINFLRKFRALHDVTEFDSIQVPSLHSQEPSNCWSLPLVTLTTIAISLPSISTHSKAKRLLNSVSEGMPFAKLVDKTLDTNRELRNSRKSADVVWTGVALYRKWQDTDLRKTSSSCKNSKELIETLSTRAERIIAEFKSEAKDIFMENPLNWPVRVVAANSMYRVCQTILLSITGENEPTEKELFEKLSAMITDVLAACFTNLPHVISTMCHQNAIEKREKSVCEAFLLLGKTEGILELLRRREFPFLDFHFTVLYIDDWRTFLQRDRENSAVFTELSNEGSLVVTMNC